MSRSAEINAEIRRLQREKERMERGESAKEYDVAEVKSRPNMVEMVDDSRYGLSGLLLENILSCNFYKDLMKIRDFQEIVDIIYERVRHVQPKHRDEPSPAFCLLYKLFLMKLTYPQLNILLEHKDSPYIRAIGFLYVRFTSPPELMWRWISRYVVVDPEIFSPSLKGDEQITLGAWVERLFSDNKYFETVTPRIPRKYEIEILDKIQSRKEDLKRANRLERDGYHTYLKPGKLIKGKFTEDELWYDARIEKEVTTPDLRLIERRWLVTYLPESEYGNQEAIGIDRMDYPDRPSSHSKSGDSSSGNHDRHDSSRRRSRERDSHHHGRSGGRGRRSRSRSNEREKRKGTRSRSRERRSSRR